MTPLSRLYALAAFLPGTLVRALQEDRTRPREGARSEQPGAILFADLSGFTPLAEMLDARGPSGAEHLRGILDACFSRLTATVLAHGGDVLRFAGDALLALWPADSHEELPRAVALAAQCAQAAQALFPEGLAPDADQPRLKVGIGAGTVRLSDVGGEAGHWDFLVSGEPLREVARAQRAAQPEEIILGPEAWALLPHALGEPRGRAGWRLLTTPSVPLVPVSRPEPESTLEPALRAYLPRVVSHRLEAGHGEWLSEFRGVTVLFINLGGQEFAAGERPEELQHALHATRSLLFSHGGSATQVVVDDNGVVMVAAFGLPPLAHEDDAVRAVQTALEVRAELRQRGLSHRLGLATGRVFCGTTGGDARREYVMVGHTVNRAARLMQAAHEDILCDRPTLDLAAARLRFELLPPLKMKGIVQPVPIFRPEEHVPGAETRRGPRVVGRREERDRLNAALRALADEGVGGTLLLEGEAGLGKSALLGELLEQARLLGLPTAVGEGTAEERGRAYHAWGRVLPRLLGLEWPRDEATRTESLLGRLRARPEHQTWAPLLNGLLGLHLPEGDVLRHMPAGPRGTTTRELLVHLLADATRERPWLVVLDDAHWLDSASWELALAVQRQVKRLLLVLALRPAEGVPSSEFRHLRDAPGTRHLLLERMPSEDVAELVCQRLGARRLSPALALLLRERAEGNPFFSEELACALRDTGQLTFVDGECRLVPDSAGPLAESLPGTIQGLLTSRLDRLSLQEQLTLKVASVLGRSFSLELLRHVHPVEGDRATLPEQLTTLERLGLVQAEPPPGEGYSFQHVLVRDVAYQALTFSQRRELHRAVALHYAHSTPDETRLPLLAHHWQRAEEPAEAITYLERSAGAAHARGAHREELTFLTQALRLSTAAPVSPLRAARWHAQLAAAHRALGEREEGLNECDLSLALLGRSRPATRWGWVRRLVLEGLRHVRHLLRSPTPPPVRAPEARERLTLAASLYTLLSEQTFYEDRMLEQITAHLAAVNLAEQAGAFSPASMSYAALGYMAGMCRLGTLAHHYFARGRGAGANAQMDVVEGAYHLTFARWEPGRRQVERGIHIAHQLNDTFTECTGLEVLGMALEMADTPGAALEARESLLQVSIGAASAATTLWALSEMAPTLLTLGREREAIERLREARLFLPRADPLAVLRYHCGAALVSRRVGERAQALHHVREALHLSRQRPVLVWSDITSLGALAQACLESWREARAEDLGEVHRLTHEALRALRGAGLLYPTARSRAARLEGRRAWLEGRPARAQALWRRALDQACHHRMPTDEGLAHEELARASPPSSVSRQEHQTHARLLFERLGAHGLIQDLDL